MESLFSRLEQLAMHIKEYAQNRIASVKLSAAEKFSKLISSIFAAAVVAVIFFMFLVFAGIAAAYALAEWTGKLYWGFLLVSGIYLVLGIVVWVAKEKLIRLPVMNALLQQLFKEEEINEEN